jgi:hypothetical protein
MYRAPPLEAVLPSNKAAPSNDKLEFMEMIAPPRFPVLLTILVLFTITQLPDMQMPTGQNFVHALGTAIDIQQESVINFLYNSAQNGAAACFESGTTLLLSLGVHINSIHNTALHFGGGVYYVDNAALTQCIDMTKTCNTCSYRCVSSNSAGNDGTFTYLWRAARQVSDEKSLHIRPSESG